MRNIVALADVSERDHALVGGKASKLGEVVREGLPVPPGFVVTTDAYSRFVAIPTLRKEIATALGQLDVSKSDNVEAASQRIRAAFDRTEFPPELRREIVDAYESFAREHLVRFSAVRSSATAEDLEGASFAGLQDTYLNVGGTEAILDAIRRCWSSVFTPRVISYRELLEVFFDIHDPTTRNRQGNDVGPQYRSIIFFHSPEQERQARAKIDQLTAEGRFKPKRIVTLVEPAQTFWRAEEYHQRYLQKRGLASCHI